jgi:hypothetical protein
MAPTVSRLHETASIGWRLNFIVSVSRQSITDMFGFSEDPLQLVSTIWFVDLARGRRLSLFVVTKDRCRFQRSFDVKNSKPSCLQLVKQ